MIPEISVRLGRSQNLKWLGLKTEYQSLGLGLVLLTLRSHLGLGSEGNVIAGGLLFLSQLLYVK